MYIKKILLIPLLTVLFLALLYSMTSDHKVGRILAWLGYYTDTQAKPKVEDVIQNKESSEVSTKIINKLDGVVVAIEKDKVYVRSKQYSVTAIYDNIDSIVPTIKVGGTIPNGYVLGRKINDKQKQTGDSK